MPVRMVLPVLAAMVASLLAGCTDNAVPAPPTTPPSGSGSAPPPAPPPAGGTGKVTLKWARPTSNEDGSALTDLSGYKVYYGTTPYSLATSLDVRGATVTAVEIQGLARGSWYFAIASYNADGVESSKSGVVTTTI